MSCGAPEIQLEPSPRNPLRPPSGYRCPELASMCGLCNAVTPAVDYRETIEVLALASARTRLIRPRCPDQLE